MIRISMTCLNCLKNYRLLADSPEDVRNFKCDCGASKIEKFISEPMDEEHVDLSFVDPGDLGMTPDEFREVEEILEDVDHTLGKIIKVPPLHPNCGDAVNDAIKFLNGEKPILEPLKSTGDWQGSLNDLPRPEK